MGNKRYRNLAVYTISWATLEVENKDLNDYAPAIQMCALAMQNLSFRSKR